MLDERVLPLLATLVGIPTVSRTPNRDLIDWCADRCEATGGAVSVIDGPDGRANLLATFGPVGPGGLLLSGHTDVVPAGDGWATAPFSMVVDEGRIAGRGTADMKGFIACLLAVVDDLRAAELRRPLHIALSYDEEVGCVGVRDLLAAAAPTGVRPELVVVGEPTMMRPRHAHLGKLAYRIVCRAAPAHSSLSPFRPSAIAAANRIMTAVYAVADEHPPDGDEAGVTVNVGTISGGTTLNVLAERCELTFELRYSTAFDADDLLAPVHECIAAEAAALASAGGGVDIEEITRYPALHTDTSQALVRLVERVADHGPSTAIGYGTEGGLFAAAFDAPVVICGPGDIAVAHRPDEYVAADQLHDCVRFLRQLIDEVCIEPRTRGR